MRNPEKQTIIEMIALLHDQPFSCSREIVRDVKTFTRRAANEGFHFLGGILSKVGKALDRALSGNVALTVKGLLKLSCGGRFPHFLGSSLRRVFDSNGLLLQDPCYATVKWLRTFCYYAYKIEVSFDETKLKEYSDQFRSTDTLISDFPLVGDDTTKALRSLMRHQLSDLSGDLDVPAFGPGISSNCRRSEKYKQFVPPSPMRSHFGRNFFHQPDEHWPYEMGLLFLCGFNSGFLGLDMNLFEDFTPSKVLFVPKDFRGPRTICCEDSRLMFAQKSLQKSLYREVESSDRFGGRVNFTDQSVNQVKTFDKTFATLDLKDASDRVSLDLVIDIFPNKLLKSLLACRSPIAALPDGSNIRMGKFAPMGSALCFPVMALCAYTAVTAAIYLAGGPLPGRNKDVFVYGDDIVVKNEYAHVAISALKSVGFAVNEDKSFVNSRFTESCGQDTLDQTSVTPLRKKVNSIVLKKTTVKRKWVFEDGGSLSHYVSLRNGVYRAKFYNLQRALDDHIEASFGKLPYGTSNSSYLCREVDAADVYVNNKAEGFEVNGRLRATVVRDKLDTIKHTPYSRLRRMLIEGGGEKPLNPSQLGARSTYLQSRSLVKWGESYASLNS